MEKDELYPVYIMYQAKTSSSKFERIRSIPEDVHARWKKVEDEFWEVQAEMQKIYLDGGTR